MIETAIVLTSINIPTIAGDLTAHMSARGHKPDVAIIVVDDLITPVEASKYLDGILTEYPIDHFTIDVQKSWMRDNLDLNEEEAESIMPWKSTRRRNLGYLRALELGAKTIITLDDDNFPNHPGDTAFGKHDFVAAHEKAIGSTTELPRAHSEAGVINTSQMLAFNNHEGIVHSRGYPMSAVYRRWKSSGTSTDPTAINLGLWYDKPDVDAYTNMMFPDLDSKGVYDWASRYAAANGDYVTLNTQNIAVSRDILPAFYDVDMESKIDGMRMGRYDDIWAGWFVKKVVDAKAQRITFGEPLAHHIRNKHDYLSDFRNEMVGTVLNERVLQATRDSVVKSTNTIEAYRELSAEFNANIHTLVDRPDALRYFDRLLKSQTIWLSVCKDFI